MTTVYVPGDAAATSVGADEVAAAFEAAGARVVRNGSRGMLWLEPLVEVETDRGRVGYGNVEPADVDAVLDGDAPARPSAWSTSTRGSPASAGSASRGSASSTRRRSPTTRPTAAGPGCAGR